ncbi:MAG: UDP-N-acetylenolpyruvoylglucosamine reductase [Candidatus Wallbacteria bacterium HGW-Wallbacteria-1]|jgi:UDP-N-acetylmuramate dehydrogenase|uniref:UDP-N-acetylenolpyruvoylglucosamine reductase n=1 Tax=Candidatus Wallbacteria bacterium HGW-Wallbacteria-1 TaxID=2013854 RepID=A0A2N1PUX7_9BACT|nr:MAG: UDP-N-acetylenolpyruvoylglucosamine reductase [Candidatus Wallbacteria bacterium HGW-Wallbacteria-1]
MRKLHKSLQALGANVELNIPMSERMHYRIGGNADILVTCEDVETLSATVRLLHASAVPWLAVGDGTNLLFTDQGFRGVVLTLGKGFSYISELNCNGSTLLRVGGATPKAEVVDYAARNGLEGLLFMTGIPGRMSGGAAMNAGTKYGSMSDAVSCIRTVAPDGTLQSFNRSGINREYRSSLVPENHVVYDMDLRVSPGDANTLMSEVRAILAQRGEKQPLHKPSCGSTFKNPEGHSAGRLIEASGLKGTRRGGAVISDKHANFILNEDGASAADVIELIETAKSIVMEKWNVPLYEEVIIIGPHGPVNQHKH